MLPSGLQAPDFPRTIPARVNPDSPARLLEPQICAGSALCWPPWIARLCSAVLGGVAPAGGGTGDILHLHFTPSTTHHLWLLPF